MRAKLACARSGRRWSRSSRSLSALQEVWAEEDAVLLRRCTGRSRLEVPGAPHLGAPVRQSQRPACWSLSAYPIEEVRFTEFELGRYAHTPWHLEWISTKGALAVRVKTALGSLEFVDTHLQASYRTGHYVPTRLAQALEVATLLGRTEAVVLAGDLNSPPDELPFRALLAASALRATSAVDRNRHHRRRTRRRRDERSGCRAGARQ